MFMNRLIRIRVILFGIVFLLAVAACMCGPSVFMTKACAAVEWTDISSFLPDGAGVSSLYSSPSGDLYFGIRFWKGGYGRLYRLSPGDSAPVDLGEIPHTEGMTGDQITGMCEIQGKLYCGFYNGPIRVFNLQENRFEDEPVNLSDGTALQRVKIFLGFNESCIYANGGYLNIYDKDFNVWRTLVPDRDDIGSNWSCESLWGSDPADIYVASGYYGKGVLLHFDGKRWSKIDTGVGQKLYGVWGTSRDDVYACGENGTVVHFDGSKWAAVTSGLTTTTFNKVKGNGPDIYAFSVYKKEILHYDGTSWELINAPVDVYYSEVAENGDVYIAYSSSTTNYLYKYSKGEILPDLVPEDVTVASAVYSGGSFPVTVTIRNKGIEEAPGGFEIRLCSEYDNGYIQSVATSVYAAVYAGDTMDVSFTLVPPDGAKYTMIRAVVDSDNEINECNEFNNQKAIPITFSKLTLSISDPEGGSIEACPSKTAYDYMETVLLKAVPAEDYLFDSWQGDIRGKGTYNCMVMTSDTSVTARFIQGIKDIAVSSIDIQPPFSWDDLYYQGCSHRIICYVKNNGNVDLNAGTVRLKLYAGDQEISSKVLDINLSPGNSNSMLFLWIPTSSGSFDLRVEAQLTGGKVDANPGNNSMTVSVDVEPAAVLEIPFLRNALYRDQWEPEGTYQVGGNIKYMTGYSPTEMYGGTEHGIIYYEGAGVFKFYEQTLNENKECAAVWKNAAGELCAVMNSSSVNGAYVAKYINHGDYYSWDMVEGTALGVPYGYVGGAWVSPDGRVYAAGQNDGKVYCFDGVSWRQENLPLDSGQTTSGIVKILGFAANDIYAAGSCGIYHYDGLTWSRIYSGNYTGMWGNSADDIYAYNISTIKHYDGSTWSDVPTPGYIDSFAKSVSGELYAVCGGYLFRYQGGEWSLVYIPGSEGDVLSDIFSPIPGVLLIEGTKSLNLYYIGSALTDIDYTPGPVSSDEKRSTVATARIRVEGYDHTILPETVVTVDASRLDLTPYLGSASGGSATPSSGWGPDRLKYPTVAHALVKALEDAGYDCKDHVNGLDLQDYGWSLYVAMIDGDREFGQGINSGWYYYVDGTLPSFGCQAYVLKGGEDIVWEYVRDYTEVYYSFITVDKTTVEKSGCVSIGLNGYRADMNQTGSIENMLGGLTLYVQKGGGEKIACQEGTITDEFECLGMDDSGNITIKFKTPGEYTISADCDPAVDIVRPAPVKINVYDPDEADMPPEISVYGLAQDQSQAMTVTSSLRSIMVEAFDDRDGKITPQVRLNGVAIEEGKKGSYLLEFATGKNVVTIDAADSAGNQAETKTYTIYYNYTEQPDTTAPEIEVSGLVDGMSVQTATLTFTVTVTDDRDGAVVPKVTRNGTELEAGDGGTYTCTLTEGQNTITIEAADTAGNKAEKIYTITYTRPTEPDTTAPEIEVSGLVDGMSVQTATLTFTVTVTDDRDGAVVPKVKLNGTAISGTNGTYIVSLKQGSNTITITAYDSAGNQSTKTYTVTYNPPDSGDGGGSGGGGDSNGGGGGGGSSSSGNATSKTETVSTTQDKISGGKIQLGSANITTTDRKTSVALNADSLEKAVNNLENLPEEEKKVIVEIPSSDSKQIEIKLNPETNQLMTRAALIQINTGIASFTLTVDTFGQSAQGSEITLAAARLDYNELSETARANVPEGSTIIELTAKAGDKTINTFNQPIKVSIPYDKNTTDGDKITVFLIKDDGSIEPVGGIYDAASKTVTFIADHFSKYFAKPSIKTFSDIGRIAWAKDAIETMAGKGIINGKNETQFVPDANITRAEFAALVARMLKYRPGSSIPFKDVEIGKWYYEAVSAAYNQKLINGKTSDTFDPEGNITRQEMATIIGKLLTKQGFKLADKMQLARFKDGSSIASWAMDYAATAVKEGIITGSDGGRFLPEQKASRAETAVILYRLYKLIMK
ncbi:MAG: hypothetical protein PWQ97_391 [Tepidanaerobacteraceae bacterium]|nr:hypothetical protein [Tepidanaerobacteraceae bacterium]